LFFDHGADVNMILPKDPQGWTPLHFAARYGALSIVIGLISRGAGINPTDNNLKTPLSVAVENGHTAMARSLIELGCDIETKDAV
jgi:ankyrin repeat protein